ncbi:MAG: hypothetical protein JST12_06445 [Armatimonadetes bacterium]|nr:hypothetical protein [Armatimonadota bacterium]
MKSAKTLNRKQAATPHKPSPALLRLVEDLGQFEDFDGLLSSEWVVFDESDPGLLTLEERLGYLILTGCPYGPDDSRCTWIGQVCELANVEFEASIEAFLTGEDEAGISIQSATLRCELFVTPTGYRVRTTDFRSTRIVLDLERSGFGSARLRVRAEAGQMRFEIIEGMEVVGSIQLPFRSPGDALVGVYTMSPTKSGYAEFDWCRWRSQQV